MKISFIFLLIFSLKSIVICSFLDGSGSNHSNDRESINDNKEILIISTLNGDLHGIDVYNGKSLWTISNKPLVSQSLSNLEFVKDGKKFRLIPSLEGQIYMLEVDSDKKGLHALPITADALFTSSFQLSSDSLLVGGKEQRVVGFNPLSGEIKYRCGKKGCQQGPTLRSEKESCDLLLCRRISHVVRAVDIESGKEKWNFSVGQDELLTANTASFPHSPTGGFVEESILTKGGCVMSSDEVEDNGVQWSFNVELGIVQSASKSPFSIVRWQRELGSSLSRVWLLRGRSVHPLSIFSRDANSRLEHSSDESGCPIRRSLYLGVHQGHLYVQLEDGSARRSPRPAYVALPSSSSSSDPSPRSDQGLVAATRHRVSRVTRYTPPLQHGFFRPPMLHDDSEVSKKWFQFQDNNECYPYVSDPLVVRIGSFLFQKLVFGCLILVVAHLVFKKLYLPYQLEKLRISSTKNTITDTNDHIPSLPSIPMSSTSLSSSVPENQCHVSRYETDYEHIRCLGRGAFGVVFEARHRVDQYHYAVKRVRVRYSPMARDKLLQEVQAFAHLEHPGIVRYYQAWFELPPDGWQEQRDRDLSLTSSEDLTGDSGTGTSDPSMSSSASLACDGTGDNGWSTVSVGSRSLDRRVDGDSLVIFDRSVSVDPSQDPSGPGIWATQVSSSVSGSRCVWSLDASQRSGDCTDEAPDGSQCLDHGQALDGSQCLDHGQAPDGSRSLDRGQDSSNMEAAQCSHIYLFISMHLYSGTTLQHRLQLPIDQRPPRDASLEIFAQIVDAVAYLHSNGLMHRDLKPSNILFDTTDHIRIVDFGLATPLVRTKSCGPSTTMTSTTTTTTRQRRGGLHTSNVGTELYMSPEQTKGSQYDQSVDIFALGIIFLELMVPLSTGMERVHVLTGARRLKFDGWLRQRYGEEVSFVSELLSHEPLKRPTCDEILGHPMLASVTIDGRYVTKTRSMSTSG